MTKYELIAKKKWANDQAIDLVLSGKTTYDKVAKELYIYERYLDLEYFKSNPPFLVRLFRKFFGTTDSVPRS